MRDPTDVPIRRILDHPIALITAIAAVLLAVYAPALHGGFVWDDDGHVTAQSLRTWDGLYRIWFEVGATQQYYPVLHSVFWLEHLLWGDATLGYHLANLFFHGTSALLFGAILRRLGIPGAIWAALIFAVHPVHVESVAWITEQKNTLSTVFYLCAALFYLRFDATRSRWAYVVAFSWFILALLTKTVTATLPGALLVILWWRRGQLSWRNDVAPLVPWFVIGAAGGIFTAWVERALIGATGAVYDLTFVQRCLLAGRVVWFYLGKLFWPADLMFIYPRWIVQPSQWGQWLPLAGSLITLLVFWRYRPHSRAPLAAVLFFGGSLFPVLGFLNVYPFRFSFVADHFQYIASFAIIALVSRGIAAAPAYFGRAGLPLTLAVVGALGVLSWHSAARFRNEETLWRITIAQNPSGPMPWLNLGAFLVRSGRLDEAVPALQRAGQLKPDYPEVFQNLGTVELLRGHFESAIALLNRALDLQPQNADLHDSLGLALRKAGRVEAAIAHHRQALALKPNFAGAENNLGCALTEAGRPAEALPHFNAALRRNPNDPLAHHNLGNALRMLGRVPEAIEQYESALRLDLNLPETHQDLGIALLSIGRRAEAIQHLRRVVESKPNWPDGHVDLGRALGQNDQLTDALAEFDRAVRLAPDNADAHLNRGIALTRLDRWQEAAVAFEQAATLRPGSVDAHLNLGMAFANTRRFEAAVQQFQAALRLQPNNAEVHAMLARLLRAVGRTTEADEHQAQADRR